MALSSGWQCHGVWVNVWRGYGKITSAVGKMARPQLYRFASMTKVPVKQGPLSDSEETQESEFPEGMNG